MAELSDADRVRLERLRNLRKGGLNPEFKLSEQLAVGDAAADRAAETLVNPPAKIREAISIEAAREVAASYYSAPEPSVAEIPDVEKPKSVEEEEEEEEKTLPALFPSEIVFVYPAIASTVKTRGSGSYARIDARAEYGAYGQGPEASTRVRAMQWLPTSADNVGDILVSFRRPSRNQDGEYKSLYIYKNLPLDVWETFRENTSLGRYINLRLHNGVPFTKGDEETYTDFYIKMHGEDWYWGTEWIYLSDKALVG